MDLVSYLMFKMFGTCMETCEIISPPITYILGIVILVTFTTNVSLFLAMWKHIRS